ncbi:M23 family metallopeptidase [Kitasatospora camelliae]|uniref:M23 family metallopeptidase n=1 Tax=Kitasatospora camelliae TaxID=3156397 RepID=A0AAU8K0I8_9ACTN
MAALLVSPVPALPALPALTAPPPPVPPDLRRRVLLAAAVLTATLTTVLPPPARAVELPGGSAGKVSGGAETGGVMVGAVTVGAVTVGAVTVGAVTAEAVTLGVVTRAGGLAPTEADVLAGGAGFHRGRAWPVGDRSGLGARFDPPPARWAAGHRGVDLAAGPGTPVRAAAPGVVTFSGVVAGRPVVTVTHPGSGTPPLRTTYLPVAGSVPVGTAVAAGQVIGEIAPGVGHCADGCLHWGLLRGRRYLDPLALLGTGRARLLPLDTKGPVGSGEP